MLFDLPGNNPTNPAYLTSAYLTRKYQHSQAINMPAVEVKKIVRPNSGNLLRGSGQLSPDKDKINFEESDLMNILDSSTLSANGDSKPQPLSRALSRPRSRQSALQQSLQHSNLKTIQNHHLSNPVAAASSSQNNFRSSVQGVSLQPPNMKELKPLSSLSGLESSYISPGQFLSESAVPNNPYKNKLASNTTPDFTIVKRSISPFLDTNGMPAKGGRRLSRFEFIDSVDNDNNNLNTSNISNNENINQDFNQNQNQHLHQHQHFPDNMNIRSQTSMAAGKDATTQMGANNMQQMQQGPQRRAQSSTGMRASVLRTQSRSNMNAHLVELNNAKNGHPNRNSKEQFGPAEITKLDIFMKINSLQKDNDKNDKKKKPKKTLKKQLMENLLIEKKETTPSKIIERYQLNNPRSGPKILPKSIDGTDSVLQKKQYFCVVNHDVRNEEPFRYLKITATKANQNTFSSRKFMKSGIPSLNLQPHNLAKQSVNLNAD